MSPYRIKDLAGKPYRPSNGTEGEMFMEQFCYQCKHDDPELGKLCDIISRSFWNEIDDPDYPTEWTHDAEGAPTCTAFERREEEAPE